MARPTVRSVCPTPSSISFSSTSKAKTFWSISTEAGVCVSTGSAVSFNYQTIVTDVARDERALHRGAGFNQVLSWPLQHGSRNRIARLSVLPGIIGKLVEMSPYDKELTALTSRSD